MVSELQPLTTMAGAYVFAVVLGLIWGSFANVCIYRWPPSEQFPEGGSVVKPDSHCFACKTPIRWYDNVPLLSYLWLRGRCRSCKAAFSPRYLLVEALTAALFAVAWWFTFGTGGMYEAFDVRALRFVIYAAFIFVMVVVTFIDVDHKLILNTVTYPSIVVFYAFSLALPERRWWDGLVGAAVGYGVPWLIGEIYYRIRKREGLGLGDGTLLAAVGALMGWKGVVFALFGGSVLGSIIGIIGIVLARTKQTPESDAETDAETEDDPGIMQTELPFGPYLAAAAVFYLFAEPWIQLYLQLAYQ